LAADRGVAALCAFAHARPSALARVLGRRLALDHPCGALSSGAGSRAGLGGRSRRCRPARVRSRTSECARSRARSAPCARPPLRRADVPRETRPESDADRSGAALRSAARTRSAVSFSGRARRGTSGALYLQSAPAGLNSLSRSPFSDAAGRRDVEDRVPRSGEPRTVSGPEGSSTKRSSPGAAERPGPSRPPVWARGRPDRQGVHGISNQVRLSIGGGS